MAAAKRPDAKLGAKKWVGESDLRRDVLGMEQARAPEERLWVAVLRDAFFSLHGRVSWATNAALRRRCVAGDRRWFLSGSEAPGSFRWVCAYLEIDPEAILQALNERKLLSGDIILRRGFNGEFMKTKPGGGKTPWPKGRPAGRRKKARRRKSPSKTS